MSRFPNRGTSTDSSSLPGEQGIPPRSGGDGGRGNTIRRASVRVARFSAKDGSCKGRKVRREIASESSILCGLSTSALNRDGLQPLADDVLHQVGDAVAVAPLVVVPADELEEPFVQLDAG